MCAENSIYWCYEGISWESKISNLTTNMNLGIFKQHRGLPEIFITPKQFSSDKQKLLGWKIADSTQYEMFIIFINLMKEMVYELCPAMPQNKEKLFYFSGRKHLHKSEVHMVARLWFRRQNMYQVSMFCRQKFNA